MKTYVSIIAAVMTSVLVGIAMSPNQAKAEKDTLNLFGRVEGKSVPNGEAKLAFNFYDAKTKSLVYRTIAKTTVKDGMYSAALPSDGLGNRREFYVEVTAPEAAPSAQGTVAVPFVKLQAVTPGVPDTGHANISGRMIAGSFSGNGALLTALNASQLTTGTVPNARLSGAYTNALTMNNAANVFAGNGAGLTALNASNISSGTLADARLSANVPLKNGANIFSAMNTFNAGLTVNGTIADPNCVLTVTNLGSGKAICGISDDVNSAGYAGYFRRAAAASLGPNQPVVYAESTTSNYGFIGTADIGGVGAFTLNPSSFAVWGQTTSGATSSVGVRATNDSSGNRADLATSSYAGEFTGHTFTSGDIYKDYGGAADRANPSAYGWIDDSGTVGDVTDNVTCVWNAGLSRYEVTFSDFSFSIFDDIAVVSCPAASSTPHVANIDSVGGMMLVYTWDLLANVKVQQWFDFVVYRASTSTLGRKSNPGQKAGETDAEWAKRTGYHKPRGIRPPQRPLAGFNPKDAPHFDPKQDPQPPVNQPKRR